MASSLVFPATVFTVRLFYREKLDEVVDFQSFTVFFVFVLQVGLRAGGRMHFHLGYEKTMDRVFNYVNQALLPIFTVLSIATLLFNLKIYIMFCFALALLSFNQGMYIARKESSKAMKASLIVFVHILVSLYLLIFFEGYGIFFIELFSALLCFLQMIYFRDTKKVSRKGTFLVIKEYFGIQVGSFIVYLCNFLFSRVILMFGKESEEVLVAYADASLICGALLLLTGKSLYFFEGHIIKKSNQVFIVLVYTVISIAICLTYSLLYGYFLGGTILLPLAITVFLLGRMSFAFCSQFANDKGKRIIFVIGGLINVVLLLELYIFNNLDYFIPLTLFINNTAGVLLFLLINKSSKKDYFIKPKLVKA